MRTLVTALLFVGLALATGPRSARAGGDEGADPFDDVQPIEELEPIPEGDEVHDVPHVTPLPAPRPEPAGRYAPAPRHGTHAHSVPRVVPAPPSVIAACRLWRPSTRACCCGPAICPAPTRCVCAPVGPRVACGRSEGAGTAPRRVPVYRTVLVPVYEQRRVPDVWRAYDIASRRTVSVSRGWRTEIVAVGVREERRFVGWRLERPSPQPCAATPCAAGPRAPAPCTSAPRPRVATGR